MMCPGVPLVRASKMVLWKVVVLEMPVFLTACYPDMTQSYEML
jgi:hypothetical protein